MKMLEGTSRGCLEQPNPNKAPDRRGETVLDQWPVEYPQNPRKSTIGAKKTSSCVLVEISKRNKANDCGRTSSFSKEIWISRWRVMKANLLRDVYYSVNRWMAVELLQFPFYWIDPKAWSFSETKINDCSEPKTYNLFLSYIDACPSPISSIDYFKAAISLRFFWGIDLIFGG